MNIAKLGQVSISMAKGLRKSLLKKPVVQITPSEFCEIAKATVTSKDPLAGFVLESCFKNGKQFSNVANAAGKFMDKMAQTGKSVSKFGQGSGKIVEKGKFTARGKSLITIGLEDAHLPETATVEDVLKWTQAKQAGTKINTVL